MSLDTIISDLERTGHGVASLSLLKTHLKETYTSNQVAITDFLEKEFTTDPITWDAVKNATWPDDKTRDSNKFKFLQGDIVATTMVKRLGAAESNQEHNLWIVKSPSCDCARASFIQVAPVIAVLDKNPPHYNSFRTALFFTAPSRFPLPKDIDPSNTSALGYYADFTEPFFIASEDKEHVQVLKSLKYNGWNMFSAVIVNLEGRANVEEEKKLRS